MSAGDDRLRDLERRVALDPTPELVAALRAQRERLGLCPDCDTDHPPPRTERCPDMPPINPRGKKLKPHYPGTRGGRCPACRAILTAAWRAGDHEWAATAARHAVEHVRDFDRCPGRWEENLRKANPFPGYKTGNGWGNANTTWQRVRKAATAAGPNRLPTRRGQAPEDPNQRRLFT